MSSGPSSTSTVTLSCSVRCSVMVAPGVDRSERLDDEVETIDAKRKAHDATLYGGTVTNARELQDLQEEIASLSRRIDEDAVPKSLTQIP